jgi:hypothetical protein
MAVTLWSATESKVMVDSTEIEGLQSIEFRVNRTRSDIASVGQPLRTGVEYGVKVINGKLSVKSTCPPLDALLAKPNPEDAKFSLSAQMKKGTTTRTVSFQECYLDDKEFMMDVNGVGITMYTFTATDLTES